MLSGSNQLSAFGMSQSAGPTLDRCAVLLLVALIAPGGCTGREAATSRAASNSALTVRVEQLVDTFLTSDDDARTASVLSEARAIFEREGIPSVATVGDAAAYGFVLINMLGQPSDFRLQFYDEVQKVAGRGVLPADALAFAHARRRQADIESRYTTHIPSHPDLRDQISRLLKDDQAVRQKDGFDPTRMQDTDRRTAGPLSAIFERYGVPTFDSVGIQAANDFIVMVQHQPPEFRRAVLPKLKANVDTGQADPGSYAMVYDRTLRDQGKNQLYGQQLECVPGSGFDVAPIDDPANVNIRRAEMGLMRLELYARLVRLTSPDLCGSVQPAK
jgi:hypothetical protein